MIENKKDVINEYDKTYTNFRGVFGLDPELCLVDHSGLMEKRKPVLDIGAGQGRNSFFLANQGFPVHAIDPSQVAIDELLKISNEKNLNIDCDNLSFLDLEENSNRYSGILIFGLIQILNKPEIDILIKNSQKWCSHGGLIFITAFGVDDPSFDFYKDKWQITAKNHFTDGHGNFRSFLESNEILELFNEFDVIHHWEGIGKEHHHGDGKIECHAMVEAVFRKSRV
jgi:2-polyprenyl-3-methyl-5-hydroxy-6-metoxy-1,4-benzoquinol methylase